MPNISISLRDSVTGAVVEVLADEGMACIHTQEGLVATINALSLYREEGRALFPEIFLVDDLPVVLASLPSSEHVQIGFGAREATTIAKAIKQCAPLAQGGWAVYIHRRPDSFAYGLVRCGVHLLSVPISDLLISHGNPTIHALMVRPVAENVVELRGVGGSTLLVYFGATKAVRASPVEGLQALVSCIVADVAEKIREQTYAFFEKLVATVLKASHGTLAVVQPARKRVLPSALRDGIILPAPIRVGDTISELLSQGDCLANTRLSGAGSLISGMLLSDGITVFGSDGSVRAYNVFARHRALTSKRPGGARRRTFESLSAMVGPHLRCAFMQSQDGAVDYRRGE